MFGLYRSRPRILFGVAAGVAARTGIHPALVRVLWIVSVPFTLFMSVAAYALLAAVLPVEPEGRVASRPVAFDAVARQAFAGFWALHGVAHVVGFMAMWQLTRTDSMPYTTTIAGGAMDLGDAGVRLFGLVWLAMVPLFAVAAISIARNGRHALALFGLSAAASLAICAVELPAAVIGLGINFVALGLVAAIVARRAVALPPHTAVAR